MEVSSMDDETMWDSDSTAESVVTILETMPGPSDQQFSGYPPSFPQEEAAKMAKGLIQADLLTLSNPPLIKTSHDFPISNVSYATAGWKRPEDLRKELREDEFCPKTFFNLDAEYSNLRSLQEKAASTKDWYSRYLDQGKKRAEERQLATPEKGILADEKVKVLEEGAIQVLLGNQLVLFRKPTAFLVRVDSEQVMNKKICALSSDMSVSLKLKDDDLQAPSGLVCSERKSTSQKIESSSSKKKAQCQDISAVIHSAPKVSSGSSKIYGPTPKKMRANEELKIMMKNSPDVSKKLKPSASSGSSSSLKIKHTSVKVYDSPSSTKSNLHDSKEKESRKICSSGISKSSQKPKSPKSPRVERKHDYERRDAYYPHKNNPSKESKPVIRQIAPGRIPKYSDLAKTVRQEVLVRTISPQKPRLKITEEKESSSAIGTANVPVTLETTMENMNKSVKSNLKQTQACFDADDDDMFNIMADGDAEDLFPDF